MDITSRLLALREAMEREGLDAYIVSGTDPHNSEYLPEAWKQREWMSGFTGSFGTLVVLKDQAGLWTDSRYFIQAEKQLKIPVYKLASFDDSGISGYRHAYVLEAGTYHFYAGTNVRDAIEVPMKYDALQLANTL